MNDIYAIRSKNLADLLASPVLAGKLQKEQALALNLGTSMLSQLTAGKKIGDDVARKIEEAQKLPSNWMDNVHGTAAASQIARPDLEKISGAVRVLYDWLELMEEPPQGVYDPIMLGIAYDLVDRSSEPVTSSNVIQFVKQFRQAVTGGQNGHRSLGRSSS